MIGVFLLFEGFLHFRGYVNKPLLVQTGIEYKDRDYFHDSHLIYASNYVPNNVFLDQFPTNTLQFRPDVIPNTERDADTYLILTLGDSFTYGHKMDNNETYPAFLEKNLLHKGYDINVLNAGVPGYGVDQQYLLLKDILKSIEPNLIVFNLNYNDIHDSNGNCLFRKNVFGSYTQVPGYSSNIYIQSLFLKYLPLRYHDLKLINSLLYTLSPESGRKNFLCTETDKEDLESHLIQKIDFLLSRIKEELPPNTEILFTLVPSQIYFSKEFANDSPNLLRRKEILDGLRSFSIFDMNSKIAEIFSPGLKETRDGLLFLDNNLEDNFFIFDSFDLTSVLFLEDDGTPFGDRHMNKLGNALIGDLVSEQILNKYTLPLK